MQNESPDPLKMKMLIEVINKENKEYKIMIEKYKIKIAKLMDE